MKYGRRHQKDVKISSTVVYGILLWVLIQYKYFIKHCTFFFCFSHSNLKQYLGLEKKMSIFIIGHLYQMISDSHSSNLVSLLSSCTHPCTTYSDHRELKSAGRMVLWVNHLYRVSMKLLLQLRHKSAIDSLSWLPIAKAVPYKGEKNLCNTLNFPQILWGNLIDYWLYSLNCMKLSE